MKICKRNHNYSKDSKQCPECHKASIEAWTKANLEKVKANQKAWKEANKEQEKANQKAWQQANPAKIKAWNKTWAKANPEKVKAINKDWHDANIEQHKATKKAWQQANLSKCNAIAAKRKAKKLKATPPWLTPAQLNSIELYYKAAKWAQDILEEKIHVDHINPLQGEEVSGLHVPWNLQLLPAKENIAKGNKFNE